jgi:hypothetical protein
MAYAQNISVVSETSSNEPPAPERARDVAEPVRSSQVLVACAVVIAANLASTWQFGFLAWDDPGHVTSNPAVQAPAETPLSTHLLTPQLGYPIPVTVASYTVNQALFGRWPASFHIVNTLLHFGVCAVCFALARRFGLSRTAATIAGVLLALHPVVAEPVSWVTGRKDLLAALFSLIALWLALSPGRLAYAGSIGCYILALLSKPVAAPIALACVFAPHFRIDASAGATAAPPLSRAFTRLVPYLIVLAPITWAGFRGQSDVGAVDAGYDQLSNVHAAWYAFGHHLSLVFFLEVPTVKYTPAIWPPALLDLRTTAASLLLFALVALGGWKMRGRAARVAAFGIAWAALAYLPSSNLLFPISRFLADSFVYLPMIGFGWSLGAAIDGCMPHASTAIRGAVLWLPLALAIGLTPPFLLSSSRFRNDAELWSHARKRFPHHARICRQWANAIASVHGPARGLSATDECIGSFGDELFAKNRGVLLFETGRLAEAEQWLLRAQERRPDDEAITRILKQIDALSRKPPRR